MSTDLEKFLNENLVKINENPIKLDKNGFTTRIRVVVGIRNLKYILNKAKGTIKSEFRIFKIPRLNLNLFSINKCSEFRNFISLFLIAQKSTKPEYYDDNFEDIYEIPKEFMDPITLLLIDSPCFLEWTIDGKPYKQAYNCDTIMNNIESFKPTYSNGKYSYIDTISKQKSSLVEGTQECKEFKNKINKWKSKCRFFSVDLARNIFFKNQTKKRNISPFSNIPPETYLVIRYYKN